VYIALPNVSMARGYSISDYESVVISTPKWKDSA